MTATDPWAFQRWAFQTTTGNPVRKAVLVALAVMADTNTGRCEALQETLAQQVEAGERAIRGHLKALETEGVIARRHQYRYDGKRRGDEYLLLAPWVETWPDGLPARNAASSAATTGTDLQPLPARIAGARTTTTQNDHYSNETENRNAEILPFTAAVENQRCGREGNWPPPTKLNGKLAPPMLVADALAALAYYCERTGQRVKPYTARGTPSDSLTRIMRSMADHPEVRTLYHRMVDRVLADPPYWDGHPHVGVIFGPGAVEKSIVRAESAHAALPNSRGLTPSGRAIAKLLAAHPG